MKTNEKDSKILRKLFSYLMPFKWLLLFSIILLMISKFIEAVVPLYIGSITQVILTSANLTSAESASIFSYVIHSSLVIFVLLVTNFFLDITVLFLKTYVGQKAIFNLRVKVLDHIQNMPLNLFNKVPVGTLMTRTIHDIDQINEMFTDSIVPLFGSLFLFLCIIVFSALYDWKLAVVLMIVMPIVFLMTNYFRIHQRICYDNVRVIVAGMNAFIQERLMGATTIRSFGLQKQEKKQFEDVNGKLRTANVETAHYFSMFFSQIDFMQSFSLIFIFTVLVLFAPLNLGFQVGTYFAFSLYITLLFRPLSDLAERYNVLQSAMAAGSRIFKILDDPIEPKGPQPGRELHEINLIEFDNVWLAYKDEQWVLKGVSFSISKGESIAIVGVTGEGKTTILNLLLRFYDFQKGFIRINGHDIHDYSVASLRKQFSIVLQDPEIFSGTIANNITLYNPAITTEKIEEVSHFVKLTSVFKRFPGGMNYVLSERGKGLSVGERQLISLARAVAHSGSILILDEATANIDTPTEHIIQETLREILKTKTAIVIAHRLSTIKDVSRILVIHHGNISESGTHEELLHAKGIYEKLYRLQFR
jgi:ATP-binding cassette subfamily B multidrug efflux pump